MKNIKTGIMIIADTVMIAFTGIILMADARREDAEQI